MTIAHKMAISEIYEAYQADGSFEHLRKQSKFVPGIGAYDKLMMIGEAPGKEENKQNLPFVGAAGRLLTEELTQIGVDRQRDVFITNVVKYRPTLPDGGNRTPNPHEVHSSLQYLAEEITTVNPFILVLMGKIATKAFYPGEDFREIRGEIRERKGRTVVITYHPAAPLYDKREEGETMRKMRQDFERIRILFKSRANDA